MRLSIPKRERKRQASAWAPAAIAVAAALGSCARVAGAPDERVPVAVAHGSGWLAGFPPSVAPLRSLDEVLRQALEDATDFKLSTEGSSSGLAAVGVIDVVERHGAAGWEIVLGLRSAGEETPALRSTALLPDGDAASLDARWSRTMREAVAGLGARHRLRGEPDDVLLALVQAGPGPLWLPAMDRLVAHRHPAATLVLLERLRTGDDDEALWAMDGLVTVHARSAVRSVVEQADRRSLRFRIQALQSLGVLGGDEAEAFLFTVAAGDADPRVRLAASEALELARARATHSPGPVPEARN